MRHIETRYLWLQDMVALRALRMRKVKGLRACSDVLTKAVPEAQMRRVLSELGMVTIDAKCHGHTPLPVEKELRTSSSQEDEDELMMMVLTMAEKRGG